jgi:hypothetical protein
MEKIFFAALQLGMESQLLSHVLDTPSSQPGSLNGELRGVDGGPRVSFGDDRREELKADGKRRSK